MADINTPPVQNFGSMLTSYPQGMAEANLATAQTGLVGQQTTGAAIANQKSALELQMLKNFMSMNPNEGVGEDQGNKGPIDPTEQGIASTLNSRYYVNPMGPPGFQRYINASGMVNPQLRIALEAQREKMVAAQTAQNQNEANGLFQLGVQASTSDTPLEMLQRTPVGSYSNNLARAIQQQYGDDHAGAEAAAKDAASNMAKYAHQYTGRETDFDSGGYRIDKTTGFRLPGVPRQGLSQQQEAQLGIDLNTPRDWIVNNNPAKLSLNQMGIHTLSDLQSKIGTGPNQYRPVGQTAVDMQKVLNPQAVSNAKDGVPPPARNLPSDQANFVKDLPDGTKLPASNQSINANTQKQLDLERSQRADLAAVSTKELHKSNVELANVKRIDNLLNTPELYTGPGSQPRSQLDTALSQYFGSAPAEARAAAYQIASKVLNQNQMNSILEQFHSQGAQVRLGAYESRLIMQALAANTDMTKTAIKQLLNWNSSDAMYDQNKYRTLLAATQSGKNVQGAEGAYEDKFDRSKLTITGLDAFKAPNYAAAKGMTFNQAEVDAQAKQWGIPDNVFRQELIAAGANVK